MAQPGVYNIRLQRRADYEVLLEFLDSEQVPINLTGWTVVAQVWNSAKDVKYADFYVTYVDRPQGKVRIGLTHEDTAELPSESFYDVMLIDASDKRSYYLEGTVNASEGYTVVP